MNIDEDTAPREQDHAERDWARLTIIGLAVLVTILAGVIIGFIVSGGLSGDDPVASPTTLAPGPTSSSSTSTSTQPTSTLAPGQLAIPASEDTYVNSGQPDEINGFEEVLEIENDPPENKQGLVRFEVSGIPEGETIRMAVLRLFVVDDSDSPVTVHLVEGDWTQDETTGSSAPGVGERVGTIPSTGPDGSVVDVDLTDIVTGEGRYDFYLTTADDDTAEFAATELGTNPPTLVVAWGDQPIEPAGTPGPTEAPESSASPTVPAIQLSGDSVVFVGAGDIADCNEEGAAVTAGLLDQVFAEDGEAIVFTAGDNAYGEGTPQEFAECYDPTWGRYKDRTRPSTGNHEYETSGASGYFDYFGDAAGNPGQGYYSYEAGAWHVIALNSNCDEAGGCDVGSPQESWLREDLASSDALCTLAYWHHPLFSSGEHGGDDDVEALFRALYDNGAEVVVNGHDHDYERFAPQDPDGISDPDTGIRQFVAGTGGRSLRDFGAPVANSEVRFSDAYGVLRLNLFPDGYEWEFLPEPGSTFTDAGAGQCH